MFAAQSNIAEAPSPYDDTSRTRPKSSQLLDSDTTLVLNRRTPFRFLKEAALGSQLTAEVHTEALLVAFTRGLMLNQDLTDIAMQIPGAEAYLKETTPDGKRFAAAFFLLHHPEARPYFATGITRHSEPGKLDEFRDNWWCPMDIEIALDSRVKDQWSWNTPNILQEASASQTPDFLLGTTGAETKAEMDRLDKLSAATDFFGSVVLPFAKAHPDDTRVPEALYWIVRAGHFGCADVNTWKTTRSAFQVLQLTYPKTKWAKQTPTWYKNEQDIRAEIKARAGGQ